MPVDLIIDVDDDLIAALQRRADANGRSLEDEHRATLENLVGEEPYGDDHRRRWGEHAREVRHLTAGGDLTPSEVLIREAREED